MTLSHTGGPGKMAVKWLWNLWWWYFVTDMFNKKSIMWIVKFTTFHNNNDFDLDMFMRGRTVPSVLWRCWLVGRNSIRPVKTEWWGTGWVICLEVQVICIWSNWCLCYPIIYCFSKIHIPQCVTSLMLAYPGCPGKRPLNGCSSSMVVEQWQRWHIFMAALWNKAGRYISALWFLLLSFFFIFSSPNLSCRRLDVYPTSTHGVSLVRI